MAASNVDADSDEDEAGENRHIEGFLHGFGGGGGHSHVVMEEEDDIDDELEEQMIRERMNNQNRDRMR